jgi:hypothetical protein
MTETPAETLRRAAALMRSRAEAATPGPWERPLDVRDKNIVGAALPDDEKPRSWEDGIIPSYMTGGYLGRYAGRRERVAVVQCGTLSDGSHSRKRNGRDLEHIAGMDPLVGLAVADWLDDVAADRNPELPYRVEEHALAVARAYLGEAQLHG